MNRRKDNSNEGYIQVHVDGDWYGICGIDFSPKEGRVVCRQLGLGFVERAFKTYKYGKLELLQKQGKTMSTYSILI